jgi:hypothetical protein
MRLSDRDRVRLAHLLGEHRKKPKGRAGHETAKQEILARICAIVGEENPDRALNVAKRLMRNPKPQDLPRLQQPGGPEFGWRSTGIRSVTTNNAGRGKRSR